MCKNLITIGLVICMLTIVAKMYSYPIGCTKIKIMGTVIILLPEHHTFCDENAVKFKKQIADKNDVLQEWIQQLFHSKEETLFLFECSGVYNDLQFDRYCSERCETLWVISELAKRESSTGKVKFKYADRRTRALKRWLGTPNLDQVIMQIVDGLSKGIEPKDIEDVLWDRISRYIFPLSSKSGSSLRYLEATLSKREREDFFSTCFPCIKQILNSLSVRIEKHQYLSSCKEFLEDLIKVVSELEDFKKGCLKGTFQHDKLGYYIEKINKTKKYLEDFFDTYLPDKTLLCITACLNSMEKTCSFDPYISLLSNSDKEVNVEDTIGIDIADAGFYMDITDAIRRGIRRVVLCAGAYHAFELREILLLNYGKSIIVEEIGDTSWKSEMSVDIGDFLSLDALRRILGLPYMGNNCCVL